MFQPSKLLMRRRAYALALLSLEAILTTANPLSTENEIKRHAQDSGSVITFTAANVMKKARATQLPVILMEGNANAKGCISNLNILWQSAIDGFPLVDIKKEDTATLLYSLGTTGKSKGVISTHGGLIAGLMSKEDMGAGDKLYLCTILMFHLFGFFYTVSSIATGNTMVVMSKFDLTQILSNIERYRVNCLTASPPILIALNKFPSVTKYDLSSLQWIISGGAPLGRDTIDKFTALFPNVLVKQVWNEYEHNQVLDIVDPTLEENYPREQVLRVITIALLCTQGASALRPAMSEVASMLTNDLEISVQPIQPAFIAAAAGSPANFTPISGPETSGAAPSQGSHGSITVSSLIR